MVCSIRLDFAVNLLTSHIRVVSASKVSTEMSRTPGHTPQNFFELVIWYSLLPLIDTK